MQQSFGEQIITINSSSVGTVRVLNLYPYSAIAPVVGLTVGVTLSLPQQAIQGVSPPKDFQLRELRGELRLAQHGDMAGLVRWTGRRHHVRLGGPESQLTLLCELDYVRIQKIESWRNGKPPEFWLQLWPSLVGREECYDAELQPFAIKIPHQSWLDTLAKWGDTRFGVLEVPYSSADEEKFKKALDEIAKAKRRLDNGEYDDAVGACRVAIEAMFMGIEGQDKKAGFAACLAPRIPDERAKEYASLLSALKQIANKPHHPASAPHQYWRAEAVFAVQTTQHLLALVGAVTTNND